MAIRRHGEEAQNHACQDLDGACLPPSKHVCVEPLFDTSQVEETTDRPDCNKSCRRRQPAHPRQQWHCRPPPHSSRRPLPPALQVDILESDNGRLRTLDDLLDYLGVGLQGRAAA